MLKSYVLYGSPGLGPPCRGGVPTLNSELNERPTFQTTTRDSSSETVALQKVVTGGTGSKKAPCVAKGGQARVAGRTLFGRLGRMSTR